MLQDYTLLSDPHLELVEKQTLRVIVQALQEYSREARAIFENTPAESETEVIVLTEDLVQYALEVAESYPINKRFAGFIDYKRVRWLSTPFGLLPQVLLVDAKASTENNRETLQQSQLPMDADFESKGALVHVPAGLPPHLALQANGGSTLLAVTTSIFVHFYYNTLSAHCPPFRRLQSMYALSLPHQRLKHAYNPDATHTFFGQGKHSPARQEAQRIRVYFGRLRASSPWRLQELRYEGDNEYTVPRWRDALATGEEVITEFFFLGR